MPAYTAAAVIAEAVESVLAQSLLDWELIVVDDGSIDATPAVLDRLVDPRIRVIRQANAGVSAARNAGLDAASGEFITFLDADDLLPPRALEQRTAYLEMHPEVDIVSGAIRVTRGGQLVRRYRPSTDIMPLFPPLSRLEETVFFGPFYLLRHATIARHRFPAGLSHCEDLIFFLEVAHDAGLVYGAVDDEIYEYRLHDGSAMSNLPGIESGYMELIRRAGKLERMTPADLRHLKSRVASILLKSWLRKGRPLRALRASATALAA